ncbi:hypothetical protein SCLCIDRAFT_480756 [Scleroderma citrinum Foug A]|uniref:Uncharacterized protein n=1 Tax=Scleroderma citrinum Foug A TaxID=1036808 RepID=A0A0C2YTE9_9AGAM|nr:hypothetical protein SCLCIDRAFT_480756 [Scleroderma citrinum Foug A]
MVTDFWSSALGDSMSFVNPLITHQQQTMDRGPRNTATSLSRRPAMNTCAQTSSRSPSPQDSDRSCISNNALSRQLSSSSAEKTVTYLKYSYCETDPFIVIIACCYVTGKTEEYRTKNVAAGAHLLFHHTFSKLLSSP